MRQVLSSVLALALALSASACGKKASQAAPSASAYVVGFAVLARSRSCRAASGSERPAIFLTINGHHQVIQALQQSLEIVPLGTFALGQAVANDLVALLTQATIISIRIGLPVAAALFLTDVAFLIIGRTATDQSGRGYFSFREAGIL